MSRKSRNVDIVQTIEKQKVAMYLRLSREDGDKLESDSIVAQREMIQAYIDLHDDLEIYNEYCDENWSGTNFNRPSFQRMENDMNDGKFSVIIVKDLSRLGRDFINVGNYLKNIFPDNHIRFIALNDNLDTAKEYDSMLTNVKSLFNDQYAVDIAQKVRSNLRLKQHKGEFIGAFASYGYLKHSSDKHKLIIDEYAADIVRDIFKSYINGDGKIRIARRLNSEKILCPSEYKKQSGMNYTNGQKIDGMSYWTYSTVHKILCNEIYNGHMVQNKTVRKIKGKAKVLPRDKWIIVENTHEAIIDNETWAKAQDLLNRDIRQPDFNQNLSIFAGYLKCGDCHRSMSKTNNRNKSYYSCGSYKRYGAGVCTKHAISHDILCELVLKNFNYILSLIDNLATIIEKSHKPVVTKKINKTEIAKLKLELEKIYRFKKGVYEDYKEDLLSKEEYLCYKSDYEKQEQLLNQKLEILTKEELDVQEQIIENSKVKQLREIGKVDELDRNIIIEFFDKIQIFESGEIEITYKFDDIINELNKVATI
ncbi:MAG: Site-specific recombinase [Clostridiaceae bacterium]|jgi:DNA invertase Pin-like site-specific DNA recombinase|nr:Site-specific recombinase [Clostridiaceae bacterium]